MSEAFKFVMFKHVTYWEKHNSGSTDNVWKQKYKTYATIEHKLDTKLHKLNHNKLKNQLINKMFVVLVSANLHWFLLLSKEM